MDGDVSDGREDGNDGVTGTAVAVVGGDLGKLPDLPGVEFSRNLGPETALVVFLPGADIAGTLAVLAREGRLAIPMADFTGKGDLARADAGGDHVTAQGLRHALEVADGINARLGELAPLPNNDDRNGLMALALAVSRGVAIEPAWDPAQPSMIGYPLLAGMAEPRELLETLARAKLLKRRFFERLHVCPDCESARLAAREVCPNCRSSQLEEEVLVHHYRCGHQEKKSSFQLDAAFRCNKCNRELRHFGVDYDTPGHVAVCGSCGHAADEPEVELACADCGQTTIGHDTRTRDWYHYELTPTAETAAAEGRLPGLHIESLLNGVPGWRSPRDLAMMVDLAERVRKRYERPYAVLMIDYSVPEEESARIGRTGVARIQAMIVDLIRETVRETDFVAVLDRSLVVFLPETPQENWQAVERRFNEKTREIMGQRAALDIRVAAFDEIPALLDRLSR